MSDAAFGRKYLQAAARCLGQVSIEQIEQAATRLLRAYERDAQIFIAGNGGSASLASHLACDLTKTVLGSNGHQTHRRRLRALSLSENMAVMTAWANDVSYELVFAEQLKTLAKPDDLLVVISASGNSPNILAVLRAAAALEVETLGLLGFDGGAAKGLVDEPILVPVADYGLAESVHGIIAHLMTAWLAQAVARMQIEPQQLTPQRLVALR